MNTNINNNLIGNNVTSSNLSLPSLTRNRSVRTRRYRRTNENNLNFLYNYNNILNADNHQNNNTNNVDQNLDNITCPVCNHEYEIYEFFTHLFTNHEEFLVAWSSLSFPTLDPDDTRSLSAFFRNLGITNNVLYDDNNPATTQIVDGFDLLTYEQLNALCDEIGYHKIGVKNIDKVAPATVRMKKNNLDDRCPVCLEDMHKALYMRIIKACGHEYCGECIEKWLQENKNCPICKIELTEFDECTNELIDSNTDTESSHQISSISESSNGGNDTLRLSPTPTPESSSESLANTTLDVSSSV